MPHRETEHLRVLIANEHGDRLARIVRHVTALDHDVITAEVTIADLPILAARDRPDLAFVGLDQSPEQALALIESIVRQKACPVIVVPRAGAPDLVKQASVCGVFAQIRIYDADDWQSSIDIVLRRFADYRDLEGAFQRRAITERAKGILMERHSVDEQRAFALLRERARNSNRTLIDVASAVLEGQPLLPRVPMPVRNTSLIPG